MPRVDDLRRFKRLVWFRDYASLWLARIDEASNEVNTFWFAIIGISTSASALKTYGLERYVAPGIAAFVIVGVIYVWGYDKARVMREKDHQKAIRKQNYVNPQRVIDHVVRARQIEHAVEKINAGENVDGDIAELTMANLEEYFKGIDLSEIDGRRLDT